VKTSLVYIAQVCPLYFDWYYAWNSNYLLCNGTKVECAELAAIWNLILTNTSSQHQKKWSIKPTLAERMVDILVFMADYKKVPFRCSECTFRTTEWPFRTCECTFRSTERRFRLYKDAIISIFYSDN